jgi:chromate transporter
MQYRLRMRDTPAVPSLGALFLGFLSIGLCGFGGTLPWARRIVVERRRWLTAAEFTELLGLCQFLPGPNVINLSVALGARFQGAAGSAAAFSGLMSAPMAIVLALGVVYGKFGQLPVVQHLFIGLGAAASALVLATALRIAAPLRRRSIGIAIATITFAAIAVLRVPLPAVLLIMIPVSVILHRQVRP